MKTEIAKIIFIKRGKISADAPHKPNSLLVKTAESVAPTAGKRRARTGSMLKPILRLSLAAERTKL